MIKTDAYGYMMWNKTFGGSRWDYAVSVEQTSDGGYILVGRTQLYSHPEPEDI